VNPVPVFRLDLHLLVGDRRHVLLPEGLRLGLGLGLGLGSNN